MNFAAVEQYWETPPCDRPGARYDRAAWRQEQLRERAETAAEQQTATEALRALRYLPLALKQAVIAHYERELDRFDALLGAAPGPIGDKEDENGK